MLLGVIRQYIRLIKNNQQTKFHYISTGGDLCLKLSSQKLFYQQECQPPRQCQAKPDATIKIYRALLQRYVSGKEV